MIDQKNFGVIWKMNIIWNPEYSPVSHFPLKDLTFMSYQIWELLWHVAIQDLFLNI